MRFTCQRVISEKRFMQRGCELRGQEEFLIFDVGFWIGAKIAHAMVAKGAKELQI